MVDNVLRLLHVAAVDEHARAVDGQGEEGLSHGHNPGLGVEQVAPVRLEQVEVPVHRAREKGHPHGDDEEEHKEGGHHELADFLDAGGHAQHQNQDGQGHGDEVPGHRAEVHRQGVKEGCGVPGQDGAGHRPGDVPQHPAHHHRVADGDAQHAQQGHDADDFSAPLAPSFQGIVKGADGARAGEAAQGEFTGQSGIAEQGHKDEVGDEKRAAAVLANPVGEEPDVAHADGRAHSRQNKAGRAAELSAVGGVVMGHGEYLQ